ncbi:hypothetical protein ACKFKG_08880 [Phormidesmis sp. 146-35]
MVSKWWIALVGVTIFSTQGLHPSQVSARSCASNCPPPVLQFTPGQKIRVQVINRSENPVQIEKVFGTDPALINQGQQIEFARGGSSEPNLSVVFWDVTSLALKSRVSKPKPDLLLIELKSEKRYPPGDRSVYIRNDGRVEVF